MTEFQQGVAFSPTIGKCYEVNFGRLTLEGQTGFVSARIQINGAQSSQWVDIETNQALDQTLASYVVQAFREIPCHI